MSKEKKLVEINDFVKRRSNKYFTEVNKNFRINILKTSLNWKDDFIDTNIYKEINIKKINSLIKIKKDGMNYFIENDQIKQKRNINDILNSNDFKENINKFDIKQLINPKEKTKKMSSIKNIDICNLKSYLNYNFKLNSERSIYKYKNKNSIKFNFKKIPSNKYIKKNNNLLKNICLKNKINDLKVKIRNNSLIFKYNFELMKRINLKNFINNKNKIVKLRNKINKELNF